MSSKNRLYVRRTLTRLFGLWFIASVVVLVWLLFNLYFVPTSLWLDSFAGALLILSLISTTKNLHFRSGRITLVIGIIILALAIFIGIVWGISQFLSDNHPLIVFSKPIIVLLQRITDDPLSQLRSRITLGLQLTPIEFAPLVMSAVFIAELALAIALFAGHIVTDLFEQIKRELRPYIQLLPTRITRLSRWEHGIYNGWRLVLAGLLVLGCFALANNAAIPSLFALPHSKFSGPAAPPIISDLLWDSRTGALLVGTYGGVFRSTDGGNTWQPASAGLTDTNVRVLMQDEKTGALLVGIDGRGVFRSTDGGDTWQPVSAGLTNTNVWTMMKDEQTGALLAGMYSGGVFRSTDGGNTWQPANTGLTNTNVRALMQDGRTGALLVGTYNGGVFRSTDGGDTWQPANTGLTDTNVWTMLQDRKTNNLLVGADGGGIFRSTDGGNTWQSASAGLTDLVIGTLMQDGRTGALLAGTFDGIFRSTDGGDTWQPANTGLTNTYVRALMQDEKTGVLLAGTWGDGVFRSTDEGDTWQPANTGLTTTNVWTVIQDRTTNTLLAGTYGGVFRSTDGGDTWQPVSAGLTNTYVRALMQDGRTGALLAGTYSGGVFRSTDGGNTWQPANTGLTNTNVRALMQDGRTGALLVGTYNGGVFRSTDGGDTWQPANTGLTDTNVWTMLQDEKTGTLVAGSSSGIFRSTDGGNTWQPVSAGLTDLVIGTLMQDGRTGALLAGTWDGGVFRSTDGGDTWQPANTGLTNTNVSTMMQDGRTGALLAGTWDGGVFRSTDEGDTWQPANTGLTNTNVRVLMQDEKTGVLLAGTLGGGMFRSTNGGHTWQTTSSNGLTDTTIVELAKDIEKGLLIIRANIIGGSKTGTTFRSADRGKTWERTTPVAMTDAKRSTTPQEIVVVDIDGKPSWAFGIFGSNLQDTATRLGIRLIPSWLSAPDQTLVRAWGSTVAEFQVPLELAQPLPLITIRALVWLLSEQWRVIVGALVLVLLLGLAVQYTTIARPFGIPLWALVFGRRRLEAYVSQAAIQSASPVWNRAIYADLIRYGEVKSYDVVEVPTPLRGISLQHYYAENADVQQIDFRVGTLRLQSPTALQKWQKAWRYAGQQLGARGMSERGWVSADELADVLCNALGFAHEPAQQISSSVRGILVDASKLRLNVPTKFPLLMVAEVTPDDVTYQALVDAADAIKDDENGFALVLALAPADQQSGTAAALQRVIAQFPKAQDFIVLSGDDSIDMLIAREPQTVLAHKILAQRDLTLIAPFKVRGAVKENMFFGREQETRRLVEGIASGDFAVIGNRRIGKSSLLAHVRRQLEHRIDVRPFMVDCQNAATIDEFLIKLQRAGLDMQTASLNGFGDAVRQLRQAGIIAVLLIDEADAVFKRDREVGEPLARACRALAQEDTCRFIFCGSGGMARLLRDSASVFFNFPQLLKLGYLQPEHAQKILKQPFDTLGVDFENEAAILDELVALTSGHPNVVQQVGIELVGAINTRPLERRTVKVSDIQSLRTKTSFTDFYIEAVWGEVEKSPLEKLITLVTPAEKFTLRELESNLSAAGLAVDRARLLDALDMLQIYSVLGRQDRTYFFIPLELREILHRTQEVDALIENELEKLRFTPN